MVHEIHVQTLIINETDNTKSIYITNTHIYFNTVMYELQISRLYMRIFAYQYHFVKINNEFLMFLSFLTKTLNKHIHFNIPSCYSKEYSQVKLYIEIFYLKKKIAPNIYFSISKIKILSHTLVHRDNTILSR